MGVKRRGYFLGVGGGLILALLWTRSLFATEYTLAEAVKNARNYWSSKSDGPVIEAQLGYGTAKAALLPNLSSSYTVAKDFAANPSPTSTRTGSITLTQDLLNVAIWKSVSARKMDLVSGACATEAALLETSRQVVSSFFGVLSSVDEEKLQIQRQSRLAKLISVLRETTKLRLSSKGDLLSAEAEASQAAGQIIQLSAAKENSLSLFRSQLGLSPADSVSISDRFLPSQGPELKEWAKWADYLPEVVALKAQSAAASYDASSANWEAAPTVALSATYNHPTGGDGVAVNSLQGEVTVTFPIFAQGLRTVKAARAYRIKALFAGQYLAKRTGYVNQLAAFISLRNTTLKAMEQANIQRDLAEKAFNGIWELLSLGKKDYTSIRTAEDDLITAERQKIALQRQFDLANANLQILYEAVQRSRNSKASSVNCAVASIE